MTCMEDFLSMSIQDKFLVWIIDELLIGSYGKRIVLSALFPYISVVTVHNGVVKALLTELGAARVKLFIAWKLVASGCRFSYIRLGCLRSEA